MTGFTRMLLLLFLSLWLAGCGNAPATAPVSTPLSPTATSALTESPAQAGFLLSSSDFKDGEELAGQFTYELFGQCNGQNLSPALSWTGAPAGAQTFALTVLDPDGGDWLHWLLFNIPAETTSLPQAIGGPDVGVQGKNDFGSLGYGGPCPPSGTHRYIFTLHALDTTLDLPAGAKLKDFQAASQGHILAQAQLTGLKTR